MYRAAVLTVSDRVSRGERPDEGGPLVAELLKNAGYEVVRTDVVPDEQAQIEAALRQMADGGNIQLLVTTGGTGFAPRDVTPEATLAVCDRLTPGIPEAMRYASMQITSRAMLSRAQAGIRKGTLILNLPGSPKAAKENLETALEAPIRQIAANAGLDGSVILEKVRTSGKNGYGFDAYKEEYCDMVAAGIIDPAKVTRSALENAASVSAMVLTTESLVADKPEPPAPAAPADPGMGGMY